MKKILKKIGSYLAHVGAVGGAALLGAGVTGGSLPGALMGGYIAHKAITEDEEKKAKAKDESTKKHNK